MTARYHIIIRESSDIQDIIDTAQKIADGGVNPVWVSFIVGKDVNTENLSQAQTLLEGKCGFVRSFAEKYPDSLYDDIVKLHKSDYIVVSDISAYNDIASKLDAHMRELKHGVAYGVGDGWYIVNTEHYKLFGGNYHENIIDRMKKANPHESYVFNL